MLQENRTEMHEWLESLHRKNDARAGKPPSPKKKQLVDIDYIAGLKCSLDSVQNQVTRIATQVASLTTSQTEILKDIKYLHAAVK